MQQKMGIALAFIVTLALALAIGANVAIAQGPKEAPKAVTAALGNGFTYQGQLKKNGNPVSATCSFTFSLWNSATGGAQIGSPQTQSLAAMNGLFTSNPIDFGTGAFQGDARHLQIAVLCPGDASATTLSRQALTPAPYALALPGLYTQQNATSPNVIGGYSGNVISSTVAGGTIGGGGVSGFPNRVLNNYATIGGGFGNTAFEASGTIGGGSYNTISSGTATIGGGSYNTAGGGAATLGGGMHNTANGTWSVIGGGEYSTASGSYATVSGGYNNTASGAGSFVGGGGTDGIHPGSNIAQGDAATISGGISNTVTTNGATATIAGGYGNSASSLAASIGGGGDNTARGQWTTIGGGWDNDAGANTASVGGGYNNNATGYGTTIGGGNNNSASGYLATIVGGYTNIASGSGAFVGGGGTDGTNFGGNQAQGNASTISGGNNNAASGGRATVVGGGWNNASGYAATVAGGILNTAAGSYSFAAGFRAKNNDANQNGVFLYADSNNFDFPATAANQFRVRSTGGAQFVTAIDNAGNPIAGVEVAAGGGSWSSLSDRNVKANVTAVNGRDILARLQAVPVSAWNYQAQDASIRHIGPMAQDFYAAFNVGEDDKHITTIDSEGVALAAIQGLYQVVQDKDAEIGQLQAQSEKQQAELQDLKTRLIALEQASSGTVRGDGQTAPTTWVLFGGGIVVGWLAVRRRG